MEQTRKPILGKIFSKEIFIRKRYLTATMADADNMMENIDNMKALAGQLELVGAIRG